MKLPILDVVREAYGFVWRERALFWSLALPGIIVLSLVNALLIWMLRRDLGFPTETADFVAAFKATASNIGILTIISWIAGFGVYAAVLVFYSVAWHRAYFGIDRPATVATAYLWQARQSRFLLNYAKLGIASIPVFAFGGLIGFLAALMMSGLGVNVSIFVAEVLLWGAVFWFFGRSSMILPAAAVDEALTLGASWSLTSGNGWRLLWIIVLVSSPFWLIAEPVSGAMHDAMGKIGLNQSLSATLASALVAQILAFIGIAIGVSALSISYRHLRASQSATTPP